MRHHTLGAGLTRGLASGLSVQHHGLGGVLAPLKEAVRLKGSIGLGLSGCNSGRPHVGDLDGIFSACCQERSGPEQKLGTDLIALDITVCFDEAASALHKQVMEVRPRTSAQLNQSIAAASKSDSKLII